MGMSIYMDYISVAGGPEEVKEKGIRKCARIEVKKKERNIAQAKHSICYRVADRNVLIFLWQ